MLEKGATVGSGLNDLTSGCVLEVLTTKLDGQYKDSLDDALVGKAAHVYRVSDGLAREPQNYPFTPNQPAFGSTRVGPSHPYHDRLVFRMAAARYRSLSQ